jgi:hypothetical protein
MPVTFALIGLLLNAEVASHDVLMVRLDRQ